MNNHSKISASFILFIILATVFNCSSDDENIEQERIPLFTETDLSTIHGDSQKSWRITEVINDFYDPNYHLEIELSCLADDVYTFSNTNNAFTVNLGDDKCFGTNDDGVFTADVEIFDGELILMDASEGNTIYLRYSRGFINQSGTAQGISIRHYTLAELSENRMVFYREGADFVGEYKQALVFEVI
ncbi:hypothetical protein [Hwangdonia lutea]|uniref:Uncharacterized protein n=1 Tax=Hwangdonia lutea TaxID=3075823 RepID=A0AA97EL93_9FLAO|nr:hypothetical protein [Hwangdonia sp. SCSIO 19198]WOD43554.1 hypothetical protein RNZ46_16315 [Hwangdonia sp. SCSIO 19198]